MSKPDPHPDWPRRRYVLEVALRLFGQYGFRKTSMEQIAQAAGISRPGLYFHYADKAALYHAALEQHLDEVYAATAVHLRDPQKTLSQRLVASLDAWLGRYVGSFLGQGIESLLEGEDAHLRTLFNQYHEAFEDMLTASLVEAAGRNGRPEKNLSPRQMARVLVSTGRGLKDYATSHAQFVREISTAAQLVEVALEKQR